MLLNIKDHPFAVEAFFRKSLVLTFAFPAQQLNPLIPTSFSLDTHQNQWAFLAIALVETQHLRPKGFPQFLGHSFFLIGYRIFVRYINQRGKRLRGLYILKSETNRKIMEWLGNTFTHYGYSTTDIVQNDRETSVEITSSQSDFRVSVGWSTEDMVLPKDSPFNDWKEARKFAGPLPFTFTFFPNTREVLIIEGVREYWRPLPVEVHDYHFSFLNTPELSSGVLASAFMVSNIPYYWKKGKREVWRE
ncbi:MAG: DUF2071 domain-containing protein [Bacteroidota bacterium]